MPQRDFIDLQLNGFHVELEIFKHEKEMVTLPCTDCDRDL